MRGSPHLPLRGTLSPGRGISAPHTRRRHLPQIFDKDRVVALLRGRVVCAQDCRRVNRGHGFRRPARLHPLAVLLHQPKLFADHRSRSGGAEADDDLWFDEGELRLDPGPAGVDFDRRRSLVDATLADALELEVLHGVRDVKIGALQTHLCQGAIEDLSCRPDEGSAALVFLVAGNFTDQRDLRVLRAAAEHRLRGVLVKLAPAARFHRFAQRVDRIRLRNKGTGSWLGELHQLRYVVIALGSEKFVILADDPPQNPIQNGPSLRIAMRGRASRKLDESRRHAVLRHGLGRPGSSQCQKR